MSEQALQEGLRTLLLMVGFRERLVELRKERGLTQQALAKVSGLNVVQITRWETGSSQPSIEALVKLARGLNTSTDDLLFAQGDRGPDEDLRLHFEAVSRLDPEERQLVKGLIESVVLKHDVRHSSGLANTA